MDSPTVSYCLMNPYRNPSILDNHADVRGSVPMGDLFLESGLLADLQRVDFRLLGSTALEPERMRFVELAHAGRFRDRLRTHFAVFHYRLDNVFAAAEPEWTLRDSVATLQVSNRNVGQTRGRGLEFGARLDVAPSLHLFGHHSYQKLTGMLDTQATGGGTPHHKTTVGFAFDRDRFLLDAAGHRVGPTNWNRNQLIGVGPWSRGGRRLHPRQPARRVRAAWSVARLAARTARFQPLRQRAPRGPADSIHSGIRPVGRDHPLAAQRQAHVRILMAASTLTRRSGRRRQAAASGALALLLATCPSPLQAQEVVAVTSSRLAPYMDAHEGFVDSLGMPSDAIHMEESPVDIPRETKVVVTFGTRAAMASYTEQVVSLHCMAPGVQIESGSRPGRVARVHLMSPPAKILETLRLLQPGLQRLGILQVLPPPERFTDEMLSAAERYQVELFVEQMDSAETLAESLRALMRHNIDALWLPPDPLLINPHSISVIREFSWSNDVPFYAPTGGLAESGASAAVAPSFRQIGCVAALEVRRILGGAEVQYDIFPEQAEITVNPASAERAGLLLAPAALAAADRIIDRLP